MNPTLPANGRTLGDAVRAVPCTRDDPGRGGSEAHDLQTVGVPQRDQDAHLLRSVIPKASVTGS